MIITIDGPSGSGKTTLAIKIAKHLNFFCLNSGYLYRGLAYVLKTAYGYNAQTIQNPDINHVTAIFQSDLFRYVYEAGLVKIYWGVEITMFLKDPEISKFAAIVGQNSEARLVLRQYEKSLVVGKDCVIEGRACGSVIYPEADIKFYITSTQEIRALRLQQDQLKRGKVLSLSEALGQIKMRDDMDMSRLIEPLVCPEGATILDSTVATTDELLKIALHVIKQKLHR